MGSLLGPTFNVFSMFSASSVRTWFCTDFALISASIVHLPGKFLFLMNFTVDSHVLPLPKSMIVQFGHRILMCFGIDFDSVFSN